MLTGMQSPFIQKADMIRAYFPVLSPLLRQWQPWYWQIIIYYNNYIPFEKCLEEKENEEC
jgi:hypothetical protein